MMNADVYIWCKVEAPISDFSLYDAAVGCVKWLQLKDLKSTAVLHTNFDLFNEKRQTRKNEKERKADSGEWMLI